MDVLNTLFLIGFNFFLLIVALFVVGGVVVASNGRKLLEKYGVSTKTFAGNGWVETAEMLGRLKKDDRLTADEAKAARFYHGYMTWGFGVMFAFTGVAIIAVMCFVFSGNSSEDYDARTVLYPTTEVATDSFVALDSAMPSMATVRARGHVLDTMYVSFTDGSYRSWHDDTLMGDVDWEYSNEWYDTKLHVQYRSKSATDGDSVVMTCEFSK
jgi:hypothetical protein